MDSGCTYSVALDLFSLILRGNLPGNRANKKLERERKLICNLGKEVLR